MEGKPAIYSIPAIIDGVRTRKGDKSLLITIATQEISSLTKGVIMDMADRHIFFFMSEAELKVDDVIEAMPEPITVKKGKESPSNRLRNTLFKLHQKSGGEKEGFDKYYEEMMEKIITFYNLKADEQ